MSNAIDLGPRVFVQLCEQQGGEGFTAARIGLKITFLTMS